MSFKPQFFIVYPYSSVDNLQWECTTHYRCMAHIPNMLQELLNVKTIGSEIKLIWNEQHRRQVLKDNDLTYQQLEDYLKSGCSMISFSAKGTRQKAYNEMKRLGAKEMFFADSYRDMVIAQANYRRFKEFTEPK